MIAQGTNKKSAFSILALSVAALGIVYGDIGTSPLYAVNEIIFGKAHLSQDFATIVGAISLVVWSLAIVVAFKYVFLVLRADSDGEGGVFALYSLLYKNSRKGIAFLTLMLILAAGLLFGDGIITPAISVLSAVEGLKVATPSLLPYIIPITVAILTALFLVQYKGTAKVGRIFGPIVIVWFVAIALLGLREIIAFPQILHALDPVYALTFLTSHPIHTLFLVLGSVMLVLTGGEAMYADMGHFGRLPIRISWFTVVFPALLLNYLGQGAYLISGHPVSEGNIFFSLVPKLYLYPMVILATMATIIASQALISGAFSLLSQAVSLGLSPFVKIIHTHHEHEGQIYVPLINWVLYIGCIILVFAFRSSTNLAAAYGLAVSGVMFMTSLSMIAIARYRWKWSPLAAFALFLPLALIDLLFLSANSLKIFEGGFIPLVIGLVVLFLLTTWRWGRRHVQKVFRSVSTMTVAELIEMKENATQFLPRAILVLAPEPITAPSDRIPPLSQLMYNREGILSQHIILLTVVVHKEPLLHEARYTINHLYESPEKGSIVSVQLNFGFMEEANVEEWLEELSREHLIHIGSNHKEWIVKALYERALPGNKMGLLDKIRFSAFRGMSRNSDSADEYFGLGDETNLSIEVIPVKF